LGDNLPKSCELLIFKCALQQSEIIAMQERLPADDFCIINKPGEKMSYGIMNEELHSRFINILSGETLERLEYLDEMELRNIREGGGQEIIGNVLLLDKLSL